MKLWVRRGLVLGAFIALPFSGSDGAGQLPIILIPLTIIVVYIGSFWFVPVGGGRGWRS